MPDSNYILTGRSAKDLVEILQNPVHAQLYALIKVYFTPFCDCDVRVWLIEQITNNNTSVINKIKELIAAPTPSPLAPIVAALSAGYLIDTFCLDANMMGKYYAGTVQGAPTFDTLLIANHPDCQPVGEYWIQDSLRDNVGVSFLDHLPEIGDIYSESSNVSVPKYELVFKTEGLDHLATGPEDADDGSLDDPGMWLTSGVYVNYAEIDSTQAEHGITYRTGIVAGKPDWPVFSKILLASRMESTEPTNNPEREQLHFELQIRNGPDMLSREVLFKCWYKGDRKQHYLQFSYDQFFNSMSPSDKAEFDVIPDYPKILTRRSSEGVGYEIKIRVRCVKGMWQLYINDRYVMEQVYDALGDPAAPGPFYLAGLGYRHYSMYLGEAPSGEPINFKTYLSDYYVRRLQETGRVDLTFAMLSQPDFELGNQPGNNFDNINDSQFFVLGKIPEDRNNNSTPDSNIFFHSHGAPKPVTFPFKLDGVPEVNGVPDFTGVTFTKWGFIGGGLEIGELLGSRPNGGGVPQPNRWVLNGSEADGIQVTFDAATGRGAIINPDPDNIYIGYALVSFSVGGQEILSITVSFTPPFDDGNGGFTEGYSRVGFANDLYYPYTAFSLLF